MLLIKFYLINKKFRKSLSLNNKAKKNYKFIIKISNKVILIILKLLIVNRSAKNKTNKSFS